MPARWREGGDTREPTPSPRRKTRSTTQGGDAYGASGTSFYTTTEKQDSYDSLDKVLDAKCKDAGVRKVIVEMLDACGEITEALRSALVTVEGSANTFGDAQLSVDVIADEIMWEVAKGSEVVAYGASEEEPEIVKCNPKGEYTICWDPLDGSSIVDNNWAVGTIIGVCGPRVLCCPFFRAPRRWREAVTAAHIRAIARPASWSTEEPAAGLAPPRRRRRGVTASPRPRSHGRPLSQWRSAAIENKKKTRAGGAQNPARATTACWAPPVGTRSRR